MGVRGRGESCPTTRREAARPVARTEGVRGGIRSRGRVRRAADPMLPAGRRGVRPDTQTNTGLPAPLLLFSLTREFHDRRLNRDCGESRFSTQDSVAFQRNLYHVKFALDFPEFPVHIALHVFSQSADLRGGLVLLRKHL